MKKTVVLREKINFTQASKYLDALSSEPEIHELVIRPYKSSLSSNQRRLWWMWMTRKSNHTGYTKEECHLDNKKRFLVPIFERDDKEYSLMIDSVRDIHKKGMHGHAKHLQDQIIKMTSITDASTKQMTECLDDVFKDCQQCGVVLTVPDDIARY